MKLLGLLFLFGLVGCTTSTKIKLSNGDDAFHIRCDDFKSNCYKKATEICPKGYKTESESASFAVYDMTIVCK